MSTNMCRSIVTPAIALHAIQHWRSPSWGQIEKFLLLGRDLSSVHFLLNFDFCNTVCYTYAVSAEVGWGGETFTHSCSAWLDSFMTDCH